MRERQHMESPEWWQLCDKSVRPCG